jgi:23S rRNA U2552 (ribose-2'-O)-methylase RlmE/FtsJ
MIKYLKKEHKFLIKYFHVKNNDHIFEKEAQIFNKIF